MRVFWVCLSLVCCMFIMGCLTDRAVDAYYACRNNDTCMAQMTANGDVAVRIVKSTNAQGWVEIIAFNIVSGLSGIFLGSKLKKKGC